MRKKYIYPNAVALISGSDEAPDLKGTVEFYQKEIGVLIVARINSLPKNDSGFFGFHIHEGKSCKGENFSETKNHYNPKEKEHPMHSGDLPPLLSYSGNAYMSVMTNRFTVREIIGRTVVIHDNADDFMSQPSGNSKAKIACGIIKTI